MKRILLASVLAVVIALTFATAASATLPPVDPSQGPWACYRVFFNGWYYFIGFYWEDLTGKGWIEPIQCFFRY